MKKHRKIIALWLCITVLFTMLFSVSFIAYEAEHECVKTDCDICALVSNCEEILKAMTDSGTKSAFAAVLFLAFVCVFAKVRSFVHSDTLVSLKVKLSN